MAREDWTPPDDLTREQRAAALITARLKLEPPVDVEAAAEGFADLEADAIPGDCDGMALNLSGGRDRPLILFDHRPVSVRKRFTIAHELGHVVLPWHVGSTICHPELGGGGSQEGIEREANRFAGELLLPTPWIDSLIADLGIDRLQPIFNELLDAEVSIWVACFRLQDRLPPGYAYVVSDGGVTLFTGQTLVPGMKLNLPSLGEEIPITRLGRFADFHETVRFGARRIHFWSFLGPVEMDINDGRSSAEILEGLLSKFANDAEHAEQIRFSLNGVLGAAISLAIRQGATSPEELLARFRGRFAEKRPTLPEGFLDDSEFDAWLRRRSIDTAR